MEVIIRTDPAAVAELTCQLIAGTLERKIRFGAWVGDWPDDGASL